jgi:hypothetical protein
MPLILELSFEDGSTDNMYIPAEIWRRTPKAVSKLIITEKDKVQGGGWFKLEDKTFTFYGSSDEFGQASLEDIQKAVKEDKVYTNYTCSYSIAEKYKFIYDNHGEITKLN